MAITDVYINGTDIQTTNVVLSVVDHDSSVAQDLNLQKISRQDGQKLLSSSFNVKKISLSGTVKGSSMADLEFRIDQLKKNCMVINGRLDIQYGGETRRYIVSAESFASQRKNYNVTTAPFSVVFTVYNPPFGQNVSGLGGNLAINEALSSAGNTVQGLASTVSFDGSAPPRPLITFRIDNAGGLEQIDELNIGKKNIISIGTHFTTGDKVLIDTDNQVVLWNGRPVNFEGVFPEYEVGDNVIVSRFTEGATALDQQQVTVDDFHVIQNDTEHVFQGFQVGTSTTYFEIDIYLRRDINARSGTIDLDIRNASGNNPGPTQISNSSVSNNVTNIPVDGGWVRFKFSTNPSLSSSTDYRLVIKTSGLLGQGNIYVGFARANLYSNGMFGYSLNNGSTWKALSNLDMAFRVFKTTPTIDWTIDKKVEYTKRWL